MRRDIWIGCGAVVSDTAGSILLVREGRGVASGRWSFPAGKLEMGETLVEAAVREVLEETGVRVEIVDLIGIYHSTGTSESSYGVNFVFGAVPVGGEPTPSPAQPEVGWIERSTVDEMIRRGDFRSTGLIERILADVDSGRRLPLSLVRTLAADEQEPDPGPAGC